MTSPCCARACQGELALDDAYCAGRIAAALGGEPTDSAAAAMRLRGDVRDERGGARRVAERAQPPRERSRRRHRLVRARERARRRAALLAHGRGRRRGNAADAIASRSAVRPTVAANGMVATSQPLATRAGLRALERGGQRGRRGARRSGRARVTEPTGNGIGGDYFAHRLAGRARRRARLRRACARTTRPASRPSTTHGPRVRDRAGRRRRLGGARRAVREARSRRAVSPTRSTPPRTASRSRRCTAAAWARGAHVPAEYLPAPRVGEIVRLPELARDAAADRGARGRRVLRGRGRARRSRPSSWLEEDDLAALRGALGRAALASRIAATRCSSCRRRRRASARSRRSGCSSGRRRASPRRSAACSSRSRTRSSACATAPTCRELISPAYLDRRRRGEPAPVAEPPGGTVYLCAVDADRMAVSFIQSNYMGFGSGLVAPGTGVALQNRGACFSVSGAVEPGRRPYHTIIPGMLLRDGELLGPFGVMGGFLQAQAHLQLVSAIVDDGLDPQAALDRPRFMVDGDVVRLEEGLWERDADLAQARHRDRARDERRLLRRRPGDPRLGRRPRRRLRSAQGRLRRRAADGRAPSPGSRSRR